MLTLWNPHRQLLRYARGLDSYGDWWTPSERLVNYAPAVDIEEREDGFVLHADLPGLKQEDIEITLNDGVLELRGSREDSRDETANGGHLRERRYGAFERRFRLGSHVAETGIEASYKDGVLTVVLPKKEEAKPRQIPVSVH